MKELGNLVIICAQNHSAEFTMANGVVRMVLRDFQNSPTYHLRWDDDEKIREIVHELNFGRYALCQGSGSVPLLAQPEQPQQLYCLVHSWHLDGDRGAKVLAVSYDKTSLRSLMKEEAIHLYDETAKYSAHYQDPPVQWTVAYDKQTKDTLTLSHGLRLYPTIEVAWSWTIQAVSII